VEPSREALSSGCGAWCRSRTDGWFFGCGCGRRFRAVQPGAAGANGDHRPDIFIADIGTDNQTVNPGWPGQQNELILSEPNGKFQNATANLPQRFTFTHSAAAADVNGDGTIDIFENNIGGLGRSHSQADILLNDGSGHFTATTDRLRGFPRDVYGNTHSYACRFADVNGDGHPDLILGGSDAVERSAVLLNDGRGYFDFFEWLPPKLYAPTANVLSIASTDVNGDGAVDLLLSRSRSRIRTTLAPRSRC
jgi:FG-GAP-like repeat